MRVVVQVLLPSGGWLAQMPSDDMVPPSYEYSRPSYTRCNQRTTRTSMNKWIQSTLIWEGPKVKLYSRSPECTMWKIPTSLGFVVINGPYQYFKEIIQDVLRKVAIIKIILISEGVSLNTLFQNKSRTRWSSSHWEEQTHVIPQTVPRHCWLLSCTNSPWIRNY